ncbi:MFS transporter [Priestia aryabhattai]|uniref:MFS transporter n=1 Tax=Priestia aryabhattai TaxID=412384 RepID=UPI0018752CCD|nr:MFS transporter [Priestia aryabhattai]MBE5101497.1 MFS transporter [Priestia aryabhattai]
MVSNEINTPNNKNFKFPILTITALVLGIFAAGSEELVISPLLLDLAESFNSTVDIVGLSVSIYGIAVIIGAPLFAPISDKISYRLSLLTGILLFLVGTILCTLAGNIELFFLGRAISGLAAGTFIPTAYAFVGEQIPYESRGKVMGAIVSSWSLSLVLGVPLGSFIGGMFHWRWSFAILILLGITVAMLILIDIKGKHEINRIKYKDTEEPLVRSFMKALFKPNVFLIIAVTFCNMLGFYGMYTYLGSYIRSTLPLGDSITGAILIFYGIGFATSYFSGKYADKIGKSLSLIFTMAILTVTLWILPHLSNIYWLFFFLLFLWGGMQSLTVTLLSTILSNCSNKYRGRILAIYSLTSNLAVTLGSALMGPIYVNFGYKIVSIVCAVISLLGFLISIKAYYNQSDKQQSIE